MRPGSSLASDYTTTASYTPDLSTLPKPAALPTDVGFLSSSTEYYYLVKLKNQWVSIIKQNLQFADGSPVPVSIPFGSLKMRKVRILQPGVYTSCAQILDSEEESSESIEARKLFSSDSSGLLKQYEELSLRLMTNVVAISQSFDTTGDIQGTEEILTFERPKLHKKITRLIESLSSNETSKSQQTVNNFSLLLENFTKTREVLCDVCKKEWGEVRLRCGHRYCGLCKQKMVQKVLRGTGKIGCFLCDEELRKVDQRVVALEKYPKRHKDVIKDEYELETARTSRPHPRHVRMRTQGAEAFCRSVVCQQCQQTSPESVLVCTSCQAPSHLRVFKSPLLGE